MEGGNDPPAEPAPQRSLIAAGKKISNVEQGMSNRRSEGTLHLEIRHSLFDILRFQ